MLFLPGGAYAAGSAETHCKMCRVRRIRFRASMACDVNASSNAMLNASPAVTCALPSKLTLWHKIAYGVGDFGGNLFWTTTNLYLLYYYTDVLKINPAIAGAIYMVSMLWDAITDPIMGVIASRTRSRWGRYRPYLFFAAIPTGFSYLLLFYPLTPGTASAVWFALLFHMLFRTSFTVLGIPYGSLMATLTTDSRERSELAAARMVFATMGALFVAALTLPLVAKVGGSDRQYGFLVVAAGYAIVGSALFMITAAFTRERVADPHEVLFKWHDVWRLLMRNYAFQRLALGIILFSIGSTIATKTLVYVFKYNYDAPDKVSAGLGVYILMVSVFTLVWMWTGKRFSKRQAWMVGASINTVAWAAIWLIAPSTTTGLIALLALAGIGAAAIPVTFWSMIPDTVEYSELTTGIRAEGFWFGMVALAQKIALGVGVGLVGVSLDWASYVAEGVQSAATLKSMQLIMTVPPIALGILSIIVIAKYPINHQYHARLVDLIARRRATRLAREANATLK